MLGELLMTLGVLVLLFVVWQVWWTDVTSDRAHAKTVSALSRQFGDAAGSSGAGAAASGANLPSGAFAIVRIPRFGADYARPVVEGSSATELAQGLGHYTGTAMPGEVGNFAIAGHRTTFGKPLSAIDTLRTGDRVVVETAAGWTVYAVSGHEIVRPWQGEVIAPVPGEVGATPTKAVLTMTSCHPKFSAKQRWVVHADLVEQRTRAEGPPSSDVSVPDTAAMGAL
ncbi:class E sortase [Knoellia locipacati]